MAKSKQFKTTITVEFSKGVAKEITSHLPAIIAVMDNKFYIMLEDSLIWIAKQLSKASYQGMVKMRLTATKALALSFVLRSLEAHIDFNVSIMNITQFLEGYIRSSNKKAKEES